MLFGQSIPPSLVFSLWASSSFSLVRLGELCYAAGITPEENLL